MAVGKCYLTEIGQVRRVLEIKEALVLIVGVRASYAHRFALTDDHDAGYWLLDHVDDGASDDCCPGLFSKGGK